MSKSDDLISRQAAVDALEKVAELYPWRVPGDCDSYSQYNEAWQDALNRADSEIEALPSAQAQRKKGKWINVRHDNVAECDQCGITGRAWMNFCPVCGADMRDAADTAKDIVHEAIDNSVWSNTVDTAKMHKVVDDKYAEMMEDEG